MMYSNPAAYERFMGRWSVRLAPLFIRFACVEDGHRILDVGCGTGSLSRALLAWGKTIDVLGVDPVADYVLFAQQAIPHSRAQFQLGAAEALSFPDEAFDGALGLLLLQDIADPGRVVREMARVTRRGGPVAACQWDFQDGLPMMSLFWQAAEAVAPEAVACHRGHGAPKRVNDKDLGELWISCGLWKVRTTSLELTMEFSSFDDFWLPFLGGATPTSAFAATLNRETGGTVAEVLRDKMPTLRRDGSFALPARAWAVAGIASH
jgi:SAM-dependent methyltransferase